MKSDIYSRLGAGIYQSILGMCPRHLKFFRPKVHPAKDGVYSVLFVAFVANKLPSAMSLGHEKVYIKFASFLLHNLFGHRVPSCCFDKLSVTA